MLCGARARFAAADCQQRARRLPATLWQVEMQRSGLNRFLYILLQPERHESRYHPLYARVCAGVINSLNGFNGQCLQTAF